MVFSRAIVRIACAVIALLVALVYCLVLGLVPRIVCEGPSGSPFIGANAFAIVLVPLLLLSVLGLPWRYGLRWLSAPLVLLLPFATVGTWPYLDGAQQVTIAACENPVGTVRAWHAWWAPVHLAVLALTAGVSVAFWLPGARR